MTTRTAAPHARSRSRRPGSGRSRAIEQSSGSLAALLRFVISLSFRSAPSGGLEGCGGILSIAVRSARRRRWEERRVGEEWVRTGRPGWRRPHLQNNDLDERGANEVAEKD